MSSTYNQRIVERLEVPKVECMKETTCYIHVLAQHNILTIIFVNDKEPKQVEEQLNS
jgi:hypothetical protein